MKTNQAVLKFNNDTVEKDYLSTYMNKLSSVSNELYCMKKFGSEYTPDIISIKNNGYVMKRYDFSLGTPGKISEGNVRRLLFTLSIKDVFQQLDIIYKTLSDKNINHRDINPGNFLFDECKRKIILTDFYWAQTDKLHVGTPKKLNNIYGKNDKNAFDKIKSEIKLINNNIEDEIVKLKNIIKTMGTKYYDGSSLHKGKTYHQIDIPNFIEIPKHKDTSEEFKEIFDLITFNPKSVLDVGMSVGYNTFNMMRNYRLDSITGFEADPKVLNFLKGIKKCYNLSELSLNGPISPSSVIPKVDISIFMNIHMWLVKQFKKEADTIMSNIINNSNMLFFQTCGMDGSSMCKVPFLHNKNDIEIYLKKFGKKVIFVRTSKQHGKKRHLFIVK